MFIGIYPPMDVTDALRELPRCSTAGVRWVPEHQWHITLRFFGDADEAAARVAFDRIDLDLEATVELGPSVSRLGDDVVCIPARGLDGLAARAVGATKHVGKRPDLRPFAGHLTLARLRRGGTCDVVGEQFAASFPMQELALVCSTVSSHGAEHETIATRPLGA